MSKKDVVVREPREDYPEVSFLKPFDVRSLGSKDDPCFGKLYDLKAEECQRCGDIELCAISFSQNLTVKRLEAETQMAMKDLQEVEHFDEVGIFVKSLKASGYNKLKIVSKTQERFPKLDRETIKQYIYGHKRH